MTLARYVKKNRPDLELLPEILLNQRLKDRVNELLEIQVAVPWHRLILFLSYSHALLYRPAAMLVNRSIYFSHQADGLSQGRNDASIVLKIIVG